MQSTLCSLVLLLTRLLVLFSVPYARASLFVLVLLVVTFLPCPLRCRVTQWEATYFDVSHSATVDCAKAAAQAGIEMIVIDDGYVCVLVH